MAILTERNIVLVSKDSNGNTCLDYPLTKAEQVENLESYVKEHSTKLNLPLSIANGGTGQTTVEGIRNILGLDNTTDVLPISKGGTGATDAATARKNLGLNNTGIDATAYVVQTYKGANSWYRKWSDGWIEQGGNTNSISGTITFPKAFTRAPLSIIMQQKQTGHFAFLDGENTGTFSAPTATNFRFGWWNYGDNYGMYWYACGY